VRASRLLSILMLLQTRGRMTAQALAAEFEVSSRTIYRDIDQLSAADVPVYADRGPSGGFQLLDGYRTKLTGLSPAEAETLFLAGLPGPAAELGLADVLTAAQLKLTAALPERARATANRVAARFHLDQVGWFRSADEARLLPAIANSVWNEMCVDVRYKRGERVVARTLQPLGLVLKAGIWYAVAQVGKQARTYRVSNIVDLSVRDLRFARPKISTWCDTGRCRPTLTRSASIAPQPRSACHGAEWLDLIYWGLQLLSPPPRPPDRRTRTDGSPWSFRSSRSIRRQPI